MNPPPSRLALLISIFTLSCLILFFVLEQLDLTPGKTPIISLNNRPAKLTHVQQVDLRHLSPRALAMTNKQDLWLVGFKAIYLFSPSREIVKKIALAFEPIAMTASDNETLFLASRKQIFKLRLSKKETLIEPLGPFKNSPSKLYITALALSGQTLFVADAGQRLLHAFNIKGQHLWSIPGEQKFIIPSSTFDVASDGATGVWVTNPGRHQLEHYHQSGKYLSLWRPEKKNKFLGCCNPIHFVRLADDHFAFMEKGRIRIRVFSPAGQLQKVIADQDQFPLRGDFNYDFTADRAGNFFVLDVANKQLRVFR